MIKKLRKNPAFNKIIRELVKLWGDSFEKIYKNLSKKWRTSGVTDCSFESIDFKMYNECDDGLVGYFYYKNAEYHESQDVKLFLSLAKVADTIIDIGANTGLYSILSSKINPDSSIYAVEPYVINYNRLIKNLQLNNSKNVETLNIALGENNGVVNFSVPDSESISDASSVDGSFSREVYPEVKWKLISVELTTLDAISAKINKKINLIKCDVETYEMSVFKGAFETIKRDKPTILFESFLDEERKAFFNNILIENGYYVYLVLKDGIVRLDNGFNTNETGLNYLISPKKSSETFTSFKNLNYKQEEVMS